MAQIPVYLTLGDGKTLSFRGMNFEQASSSQLIELDIRQDGDRTIIPFPDEQDITASLLSDGLKSITVNINNSGNFLIGNYEGESVKLNCCVSLCGTTVCGSSACITCGSTQVCC